MNQLTVGVIGRSSKTDERRLPIHPRHFERIEPELRERIFVEDGYGEPFGVTDAVLAEQIGGIRGRDELIAECDIVLLAKPLASDVAGLRDGQVLWGWPHCVQDTELTQAAIDRRLTLIAFEAMNFWTSAGAFNLHVFHKNNELAGYSSVQHALQLIGSTGNYGPRMSAAVIGFGATARGAVTVLKAHGIYDISVLTNREVGAVGSQIHATRVVQFTHEPDDAGVSRSYALPDEEQVPLAEFLAGHDIIVNCTLQDPNDPLTYLTDEDLPTLAPGTLIVDVSCDAGMGFDWARPTSFADPMFDVGDHVHYYAVDHSPSYLWNSASWEISEALLPYLAEVLAGPEAWDANETLRRAIEIRDGHIVNPDILEFQGRGPEYPHSRG